MKAFFEHIKARLLARMPELKTVQMFNNQFERANGADDATRQEMAIIYPACFIEFMIEDVSNLAMGFKLYFLRIRFRFGVESYKFERLETFDFIDEFYQAIHLMCPDNRNILNFTSFQEISPEFDEDHNNVERPYIDYHTRLLSQVAYRQPVPKESVDLDLQLEVQNNPLFYESYELDPVYFYEPAELTPVFIGE